VTRAEGLAESVSPLVAYFGNEECAVNGNIYPSLGTYRQIFAPRRRVVLSQNTPEAVAPDLLIDQLESGSTARAILAGQRDAIIAKALSEAS